MSILSFEEWNFLTRNLISGRNADRKATYWLGGFIDQNSQLVWMDRMPFNFSGKPVDSAGILLIRGCNCCASSKENYREL